jgi:hypothetical protein
MNWLEIIELRSVEKDKEFLTGQLERILHELEQEFPHMELRSYTRPLVETDFSIHLLHSTENMARTGSEAGLRLVAALRELGLVHHTVWKQTPSL